MALLNEFFLELPGESLFSDVAKKINTFKVIRPNAELIDMGINDVTSPLPSPVVEAMHKAVDDMADSTTFHGYGPEQGYEFLREAIVKNDFNPRGIHLMPNEVFINDGVKSEIGNIGDILRADNTIGVIDPIYPIYIESNVISGRAGVFNHGKWSNVCYLNCNENNGFTPMPPEIPIDIVYLCSPDNPTGAAYSKGQLKKWVDYALKNNTLILFDASYEAYIQSPDIPHSIYEIRGAKKVAIELRSFSRTAGFTGLRCGYTIIPKELMVQTLDGRRLQMNTLWSRRQSVRFNGVSYITQCAAAATYSPEGEKELRTTREYYMENARLMRRILSQLNLKIYGGEHIPYLWIKIPTETSSWEFFESMLYGAKVICTPGVVFGPGGEGFVRLSAFAKKEACEQAAKRLRDWLK
ncbi:MAG: LL-diaminopimelate aminotransferase [Bacteroidaceae bacterium]|nr:LL-diaminopimelate aminotransferase [Bacteroidaceae bacterium]